MAITYIMDNIVTMYKDLKNSYNDNIGIEHINDISFLTSSSNACNVNYAYSANYNAENIKMIIDYFKTKSKNFIIFDDNQHDQSLFANFEHAGLWPEMLLEKAEAKIANNNNKLIHVNTAQNLAIFSQIAKEVFDIKDKDIIDFIALMYNTSNFELYLLFNNNHAVGTVITHESGDIINIQWVGIKEKFRRQNLGFDICDRIISLMSNKNKKFILFAASVPAQNLYKKLGFQVINGFNTYIYELSY